MRRAAYLGLLLLGFAAGALSCGSGSQPEAIAGSRRFNVLYPSGDRYAFQADRLLPTGEYCSGLYTKGRLVALFCGPHTVAEVEPPPEEQSSAGPASGPTVAERQSE